MDCNHRAELAPLYFSGELDAARTLEFGAHLQSCELCARIMEQHAEIDARLRQEILHEAFDTAALEARIEQGMRRVSLLRRIAAVAAAAILAIAFFLIHGQAARLASDAAQDHHREVVDREPRAWSSDATAVAAMAARAGVAVRTLELPGFRLERAKLCRLGRSLYLHLVYSDGAHEFSLFLGTGGAAPATRIACTDHGAEHVAEFQKTGLEAFVVTDESADEALRLARSAANML